MQSLEYRIGAMQQSTAPVLKEKLVEAGVLASAVPNAGAAPVEPKSRHHNLQLPFAQPFKLSHGGQNSCSDNPLARSCRTLA